MKKEIKKPQKQTIEYYDFLEIKHYIKSKYSIDFDDRSKESFHDYITKRHTIFNGCFFEIECFDDEYEPDPEWILKIKEILKNEFGEDYLYCRYSW